MVTASDVLATFALGGLIAIVGQATRAIIGLKKRSDEAELSSCELDVTRLVVSFAVAFISGIIAVLLLGFDSFSSIDLRLILALAASGYVGADLTEGLLCLGSRTRRFAKLRLSKQNAGQAPQQAGPPDISGGSDDAKIAFNKIDPSVFAQKSVMSLGKKSEDVQSCLSLWLQQNKNVSSADSRNLTKNISDFHISTNNEMEQFIWGVAQCLSGKRYTYVPNPDRNSPDWNLHVAKLMNGTLSTLANDFVSNIT
jgi:hypothetical protein